MSPSGPSLSLRRCQKRACGGNFDPAGGGVQVVNGVEAGRRQRPLGTPTAVREGRLYSEGHNLKALADYLGSWRGKFTYRDTTKGSEVVYDTAKEVLVVKTPYNIHACQYSLKQFEDGDGRFVLKNPGGTP
ncbi:hypothetical protein [Streptomyces sp. NPDC001269]